MNAETIRRLRDYFQGRVDTTRLLAEQQDETGEPIAALYLRGIAIGLEEAVAHLTEQIEDERNEQ